MVKLKKEVLLFICIVIIGLFAFGVYGAKVLTNSEGKSLSENEIYPLIEIPITTCSGNGELYLYQQDPFQDSTTSFTTTRNQLLIFTRLEDDGLRVKVNGINVALDVALEESVPFKVKVFSLDTHSGDHIEVIGSTMLGTTLIPARKIQGYLTQDGEDPAFDVNSMEVIYDDVREDVRYLIAGEHNYLIFDKYSENAPGEGSDNRFLKVKIKNPLNYLIVDKTYTHPYPSPVEGAVVDSFVTNTTGNHVVSIDTQDSIYWMSIECPIEEPYCGDGILDNGEECDDGNNVDGDGCSSECSFEDEFECADLEQQEGLFGRYYNYFSNHPDMELPSSEWPDNGHGDPEGSFDTDWYENQYFRFLRVDNNLNFGNDFFPFDMGAEEITEGHEFHFGAHWEGQIFVPVNGNYEFEITSDDDAWVYVDGNLVLDDGGIHTATYKNISVALNAGVYPLDVYFAERHTTRSYLSFDFDDRLIVRPIPDECDDCGNGVLDDGEECDDGNNVDGDGCSSECTLEGEPYCGDGVLQAGEECDDGNLNDFDGCDKYCRYEPVCEDEDPLSKSLMQTSINDILSRMGSTKSLGGGANGISITTEDFAPRVWMDASSRRIFASNLAGGGYLNRINNYAFEGEQISWDVLVWDANGVEKIKDVYVTIGDLQGDGNDIQANCNWDTSVKDNVSIDRFTPSEGEENLYCFDKDTMAVYHCLFTVETPESMYDEYWITVEAEDLDGLMGTMDENEYWFLNPELMLSIDGAVEFDDVRPGTNSYSGTIYVGNDVDGDSGVLLNMTISGTDFYDPYSSGAMCPNSNVLRLSNFAYFATNGDYSSYSNYGADSEGYDSIPYEQGNPRKRAAILDSYGNILTPGSEIALTFRLSLPSPCNGDFSDGDIYFWGEAI